MKLQKSRLELIFPALLLVTYLLTLFNGTMISLLSFWLVLLVAILYFFPIRFLIFVKGRTNQEVMKSFFLDMCFSYFTCSLLFTFFMRDFSYIQIWMYVNLGLAVIVSAFIYCKQKISNNFITCVVFAVLFAVAILNNAFVSATELKPVYQFEEIDFNLFEQMKAIRS